jgi:PEP-CTERM motif
MSITVSQGAKRVSRSFCLSWLGAAIASASVCAQAADVYSAQLDITDIRYAVSAYGDTNGGTPTVTMGGAPLSAHFYQEYGYSQATTPSAVSPDGTRQVQLGSDAWSMRNGASQQDVAELWAAPFTPGNPGQGRLGVMVSTLPPEQFVLPSSEPADYIQFTLSPHSQLDWSATMSFSMALDAQAMADTLKVHATDTIHPMLFAGGVFYGTPFPIGLDEAQMDVLNALGYSEIQQSFEVALEFDAQGNWTMVGEPGQGQRQLSTTLYNPFDTEITYAMSIFAGQEMVFYRNDLGFNPLGPVPEPGTWALMGLGLVGIGLAGLKRRSAPTLA